MNNLVCSIKTVTTEIRKQAEDVSAFLFLSGKEVVDDLLCEVRQGPAILRGDLHQLGHLCFFDADTEQ